MDSNLQNFSKHVPHILRQQLLLKLSKNFINESNGDWNQASIRTPTIQRFRGALLFVDISGFTVLSQRLDIESLKNHINDYFTKMLAIVEKWGGDVIKFAGDALFIVWHSQILEQEHSHEHSEGPSSPARETAESLMAEAAERAVACALEICSSCGHYEVKIQNIGSDAHTHMFDRFMPQRRNSSINSGKVAPIDVTSGLSMGPPPKPAEEVTYLDVHCGISMGLMAGIDVGYDDRWEYFLAGTPLSDVASAEDKAKKGDVVVSAQLHKSIHGGDSCALVYDDSDEVVLSCGCACLAEGFCRVKKIDTKPPLKSRKNRFKARKEGFQAIANENSKIIEDITHDMDLLFIALNPMFRRMYSSMMSSLSPRSSTGGNSPHGSSPAQHLIQSQMQSPARRTKDRRNDQLAAFINYELRKCYQNSVTKVLTDDLARHVHDAVRSDYEFSDISECENFRDSISAFTARSSLGNTHLARNAGSSSLRVTGEVQDEDGSGREKRLSTIDTTMSAHLAVSSEILTTNAEVRSVTVMFIKIDTINLHILTDTGDDRVVDDEHAIEKVFGFLVRSAKEIEADKAIITQIQGCFAVLHSAIYGNGGQLRQFIVDDKGTVGIATFGLRGAVSVDNAASAIETAQQIIQGLPSFNLTASIGITTGKAYCGLVGSPLRHEYAVMGPSTNLSARLMCKAQPNSVICDEDTMKRDRLHEYHPLAEIQAKGYSQPVKIFRPAFHGILPETIKPTPAVANSNSSATHLTLKVAARQVVRGRKDTRFASIYTYLMRKMHLDWILSNRSKWELELRDMINSPFFYENEFNKAQRKSISETSLSNSPTNHNHQHQSSASSSNNGNSFHGIPTPIRKLHGRKKEVKRILTSLLPPLLPSGAVMFGFESPTQMVVISGGMGCGKTAILSAIARKIQFMAERDRCLNIFIARKKSITMKSRVPFSFWKPMVTSLITLFTKDTTATSLPATGRIATNTHNANIKKIIIGLDKMLRIYAREQLVNRDLMLRLLMAEDDAVFSASEFKAEQLEGIADALATLIDFMPALANRFIIIFIEDIHFLDPWSLRVMFLIWKKATGMSLLVTYDGDQTPLEDLSTPDHAHLYRIVNQQSKLTNSGRDHFFRPYNDSRRFAVVDLPPLDKESTIKVAKEALADVGIVAGDADLAKLFDISGGNPLYTIELTKALQTIHNQSNASRAGESFDPNQENRGDIKADLNELFNMNSRVEEVICYRFDKLTTAQQLVLKAASVAVSNGRSFTAEMIVYLLEENDHFSVSSEPVARHGSATHTNNLALIKKYEDTTSGQLDAEGQASHHDAVDRILLHLVHHHDFIKLMSTHDRSGAHHGKQYNFTIPLEQTTIYQLVIDEQKEYFHERMARYCRQSATRRQVDAVDDRLEDLKEEAFHWEHATSWGNALKALMKCATVERQRGNEIAWLQYLQSSYGLFKQLEQEIGLITPMPEEKLPDPRLLAKILMHASSSQNSSSGASIGSAIVDEDILVYMKTLDRELQLMFETFSEVELDVVPMIFFLHLSLADAYILAWEDIKVLISTMSVALRLALAAKYFEIFPGKTKFQVARARFNSQPFGLAAQSRDEVENSGWTQTSSGKQERANAVASVKFGKNTTSSYRVYSFTIPHEHVLHFVSTLCLTYYTSFQYVTTREKDIYGSMKMMQVPSILANATSGITLDVEDPVQNLTLTTLHLMQEKQYESAYQKWRESDHWAYNDLDLAIDSSRRRIQHFGMDATLFVTSRFVQWLVLSGRNDIFRDEVRVKLLDSYYHIPHIPSLEFLTAHCMAAFVSCGDYDSAVQCRGHYRQALLQYKEQVEVSSFSLKQVVLAWSKTSLTLSHPEEHMEAFEMERLRAEDLYNSIATAEGLNHVKQSGSDLSITLLTLQCMLSSGMCLNSLALQLICGLYFVLPTTINELIPADELFEKWFNRLVHTMVLATNYHNNNSVRESRELNEPVVLPSHLLPDSPEPSEKDPSQRTQDDSPIDREKGYDALDDSILYQDEEEEEAESPELLVNLDKEPSLSNMSTSVMITSNGKAMRTIPEENYGGNWSILNVLNPLTLLANVLDQRQSEGLASFLPLTFHVLHDFFDLHLQRLLLQLEEQGLVAARQNLASLANRLRAIDPHDHRSHSHSSHSFSAMLNRDNYSLEEKVPHE